MRFFQTVELCENIGCELICHEKCTGSYRAAHTIGDWPEMPEDIRDNELSQVIIPQGLSFEYFENSNFGGHHRAFGSQTTDLIVNMTKWWLDPSGSSFSDNAVSSFKVRQIPSGRVKLCRYRDCSGGYVYYAQCVGRWNTMPFQIGGDALSYISIPRGFRVELFGDERLGGSNWGAFGSKYYNVARSLSFNVNSFSIGVW